MLKTGKLKKITRSVHCITLHTTEIIWVGGWVGRSVMVDATKTTAHLTGHMTYTQAPAVSEKNIFHFFRFTQPVENYPLL